MARDAVPMDPPLPPTPQVQFRALAAGIASTWVAAGTFLVGSVTTTRFAPLELGWFRIMASFLVIRLLYEVRGKKQKVAPADRLPLVAMGLLGVTGNQLLFLHGIHHAAPVDGALIYALLPLTVMVIARFTLGESLTRGKVLGILLAFGGVLVVLSQRGLHHAFSHLQGDLLLVGAMLSWAGYTLVGKRLMGRYRAMTVNTWAFGVGALSVLPLSWRVLGDFDWSAPGTGGWLGLGYLSLVTSVLAFNLWGFALKNMEASRLVVLTNLQPPMTVVLVWIFQGHVPAPVVLLGMVMVMIGVMLSQRRPAALAPDVPPVPRGGTAT